MDADEIAAWALEHPQPYDRDAYQGAYADVHGTPEEPATKLIHALAKGGIEGVGHHGPVSAMGVPPVDLPKWDDLQVLTAQLHRFPLLDDEAVASDVVIGPRAKKPLRLDRPLFVSDMSFGALSEEAKVALAARRRARGNRHLLRRGRHAARGAGGELALPLRARQRRSSATDLEQVAAQDPGLPLQGRPGRQDGHGRAPARQQGAGQDRRGARPRARARRDQPLALPRPRHGREDFREMASSDQVREATGGIPIGFKLSAQHIERGPGLRPGSQRRIT